MRLTVLGAGAVRPNPGGACSGYLLQAGGYSALVDCGFGILSRLTALGAIDELDAVIVTHAHPDHCADLVGLHMALRYGPGPARQAQLPVYAGPAVADELARLGDPYDEDIGGGPLGVRQVETGTDVPLGPLHLRLARTTHHKTCFALRIEQGGRSVVFTGDTGPSGEVTDLSRNVDVLLAEATLGARRSDGDSQGHLAAEEAGVMAAAAEARLLLLAHYYDQGDPNRLVDAARAAGAAQVRLASEGNRYDI